ncbi:methyltransferase domain-containing protein [Pedobacter mucosus]|uniref:methyltransferase domain-containing protein n=1 Tax=Pedobacter mucosus TaxID=2895286 RepID=UPI001EE49D49|nr:methyltransferase domain-containing protein [Pedobacter mucosus]UKT64765.1 tRNA (guanine-N(7)-)-methyltransferase [Pedobacter mucosus]
MINKIFDNDQAFDWLYPRQFQLMSKKQWTPLAVAIQSAAFLASPGSSVLDIGSGIGKFCLIGAKEYPETMFFGVEQRNKHVYYANDAKNFLRIDNLEFIHANITQINFRAFDHFYFYNSFFENIDFVNRIDDSVETSIALYSYYTQYLRANLDRMPIGTKIVTYQSSGTEVSENFCLVSSTINNLLKMYIKIN